MLAELFCRSGRESQGRAELRQALRRMSGDHARVFLVLDVCVTKDGDVLDFIDAPEALSALLPRWSDARVLLVAKMIDTRDPALLGPMLAAARRQKDERTWRSLSRIEHPAVWAERAERTSGDEALAWLEKAAKHEQAPRGVRERYVAALIAANRLDDAEAATVWIGKECAEGYGACRPLHVARAKIFLANGAPKRGIAELKLVLARDPRDVGIWALLAAAYDAAGQSAAAEDARERAKALPSLPVNVGQ
jgi:tetratricopeptide (TPR) repeat protein